MKIEKNEIHLRTQNTESDTIVIAVHGFGGSKASHCIERLEGICGSSDIGSVKFDWPGHGEDRSALSVDRCLSYLEEVTDLVNRNNDKKLIAFATSFGGYLTMLFNKRYPGVFAEIILRSPALRMYDVMTKRILDDEMRHELKRHGTCLIGDIEVSEELISELNDNNLFSLYDGMKLDNITIMHGTEDELVPFADSESFCSAHGCRLIPIVGADHQYSQEKHLDQVIAEAEKILRKYKKADM